MTTRLTISIMLLLACFAAAAAEPVAGPYVTTGGPAFKVEDRDVPLRDGQKYRVVYEVTEHEGEMSEVNRELTVVARFLNMHGQNGVPLENLDVAVVVHGKALLAVMNDETYREMHGIANPSLPLIRSLADAGVKFYACGQSLGFRGLDKSVLAEPVRVGLSAMTMLVTLQSDGYAFLP